MVGEPDLGQTIPFARRGKHPQLRRTGFGTRQDEDDNQEEEDGNAAEQKGKVFEWIHTELETVSRLGHGTDRPEKNP